MTDCFAGAGATFTGVQTTRSAGMFSWMRCTNVELFMSPVIGIEHSEY